MTWTATKLITKIMNTNNKINKNISKDINKNANKDVNKGSSNTISKDIPVCQKNDEILLDIEDLGTDGEGIGRYKGYTLFVKDALPGDKVHAIVIKTKKNYGYARILDIIKPSGWRIEAACPVAKKCGGCQLQHCNYEKQLEWKKKKIEDCLNRIAGLKKLTIKPVIGMEMPYYYRNKAQFPAGYDKAGNIITGFYAGRTHSIIPFKQCCIQHPCNSRILEAVTRYMEENQVTAYNETGHTGIVRHIITRIGEATGEIMVCLVINADKLPYADRLVTTLLNCGGTLAGYGKTLHVYGTSDIDNNHFNVQDKSSNKIQALKIKSICINKNTRNTNVILGKETEVIYGSPYITDYIGDIKYHISPLSFYQVNHQQTEKLYKKILEMADLKGNETVWDIYCGIGTIALFLAKKAAKVYGVEIVPQAVEDAIGNAMLNNIYNAEFFTGAAEEVVPLQYKQNKGKLKADIVTLDPPRKGCDEKLLETVINMEPKKIIYISCDPGTLARDLKYLCERKYQIEEIQPYDMFSQTMHVETACLLTWKA